MMSKKYSKITMDKLLAKYPPRGSWGWHRTSYNRYGSVGDVHDGYVSDKLKKCPVCGRLPVFQEDIYQATPADQPAKIFYGFCPTCELRTRKPGTLKEAVIQWQARKFSPDSLLICRRPRLCAEGCRRLSNKLIAMAIDDAVFYAQERQETVEGSNAWKNLGTQLQKLEEFFRTSVFMFGRDADSVISDIRMLLYPELEPKDRIRIPLHLDELYKGKEIVIECMNRKNGK